MLNPDSPYQPFITGGRRSPPRRFESMRMSVLIVLALLTAACGHGPGPRTLLVHAPIHPGAQAPVTLSVTADDKDGVASIEIWEERNTFQPCEDGGICAAGGTRTMVKACDFPKPAKSATCDVIVREAYPDRSFIGYSALAKDRHGNESPEDWVYFAAGMFPWPDRPIPVYVSASPEKAIDLVVIPDPASLEKPDVYGDDVTMLIRDTFLGPSPPAEELRNGRRFWNFYVTYHAAPGGKDGRCPSAPANWARLRGVVDVGLILRRGPAADCIGLGPGALITSGMPSGPAPIHALGHTIFRLADEYCCDGVYWQAEQHPNIFATKAACRDHAGARDWPVADCVAISPPSWWRTAGATGWYRADKHADLMG